MPRSYNRRSPDQRLSDLETRIAELKAKQAEREKRGDPILREIQKLQKQLKQFIQVAHNNQRPDVANSAMGFKSMLERILSAELSPVAKQAGGPDKA